MTREATSQGRRGGIFLASRVFFLAMFAVVALRSTTVLATMESVSGDTAVDRGGDVARIRGRKLTQQTGPYTYSFTVNAEVYWSGVIGPWPFYVKLDGVMPSVDQFTVHVAPDRVLCEAGTGGSCVAVELGESLQHGGDPLILHHHDCPGVQNRDQVCKALVRAGLAHQRERSRSVPREYERRE